MTEKAFILQVFSLFEQLEGHDFDNMIINGDVKKIYNICKKYLQERGLIKEDNNHGNRW